MTFAILRTRRRRFVRWLLRFEGRARDFGAMVSSAAPRINSLSNIFVVVVKNIFISFKFTFSKRWRDVAFIRSASARWCSSVALATSETCLFVLPLRPLSIPPSPSWVLPSCFGTRWWSVDQWRHGDQFYAGQWAAYKLYSLNALASRTSYA